MSPPWRTALHPRRPEARPQWLRGDSTWANAPGRLASFTVLTTAGAGTYTTPANITAILVECVGGGGGGGPARLVDFALRWALPPAAAAVADGSYSRKYVPAPLSSYSLSIGAAGTGGGTSGTAGTAGGSTIFGSVFSCNGESGGLGAAVSSTIVGSITLGGAGGAASTNGHDHRILRGSAGGNGITLARRRLSVFARRVVLLRRRHRRSRRFGGVTRAELRCRGEAGARRKVNSRIKPVAVRQPVGALVIREFQ